MQCEMCPTTSASSSEVAAEVHLWGRLVGTVHQERGAHAAVFRYHPQFIERGPEVSPLVMPLRSDPYTFPGLAPESFRGLPGLLADSLPDHFGNAVLDAWLAVHGRDPARCSAVERLWCIGSGGMGALELTPPQGPVASTTDAVDVGALVQAANDILSGRLGRLGRPASPAGSDRAHALRSIFAVGISAGGARAKAVIAWNPDTGEVRSGQTDAAAGFEHWLLKLDGVSGNRDKEREDPQGYGVIEYGYALMARAAGITMAECRLLEEHGRRHFMTRRFDRPGGAMKLHMHSLAGLAHYDFNQAGAHSYEQALAAVRRLGGSMVAVEEQYRRMVFNVMARNQDDHVKNIAFLMDPAGQWSLSPAFDVTFAYAPDGRWTSRHQMTVHGRRADITLADLHAVAATAAIPRRRADDIVATVRDAVARWPQLSEEAGVPEAAAAAIGSAHCLVG